MEVILAEHREALARFLRARGAGDDAEDLLQELWLKVSAGSPGPVAHPLAYLYRTANNLLLDRRRSELRGRRRDRDWTDAAESGEGGGSDLGSGERVLLAREQVRAAQETLAVLGERTETIFHRFRLEGLSQQQIAAEMGISLSAVEKHLQKAYRSLLELRRRLDAE